MTAEALNETSQGEQKRQERLKDRILCCTVAGCLSAGAEAVRAALQDEVDAQGRAGEVEVCGTGCMGLCCRGPLVRSSAADVVYTEVTPQDARSLVEGDQRRFKGRAITPGSSFLCRPAPRHSGEFRQGGSGTRGRLSRLGRLSIAAACGDGNGSRGDYRGG